VSATTNQQDQAFLNEVHGQAPDISSYRTGSQLLSLGQAICTDFESGASAQEVADRIPLYEGSPALPPSDLGAVMTAAADQLCPRYRGVLGP
jgi:hypothetical protein